MCADRDTFSHSVKLTFRSPDKVLRGEHLWVHKKVAVKQFLKHLGIKNNKEMSSTTQQFSHFCLPYFSVHAAKYRAADQLLVLVQSGTDWLSSTLLQKGLTVLTQQCLLLSLLYIQYNALVMPKYYEFLEFPFPAIQTVL